MLECLNSYLDYRYIQEYSNKSRRTDFRVTTNISFSQKQVINSAS